MGVITDSFTALIDALRYPLDDPNRTIISVLVIVVAGLLVTVALIAIASPKAGNSAEPEDGHSERDTDAD